MSNESSTQAQSPRKKITTDFYKFIELALRKDDNIELEDNTLALIIKEIDGESLLHVELPSEDNKQSHSVIWKRKAWIAHEHYRKQLVDKSRHDNMMFDNMKFNRELIVRKLREVTGQTDYNTLLAIAIQLLKTNPDDLSAIGVELKVPYYKGVYDIMPFKPK